MAILGDPDEHLWRVRAAAHNVVQRESRAAWDKKDQG